jgi:hypothetical protein
MKLCKDCKHVSLANPLLQVQLAAYGRQIEARPMCAHPNAARDCVYGSLTLSCADARIGKFESGLRGQSESICGPDANLFEEKPAPEPAPDAGSIVYVQPQEDIKLGWFARLFGW